MARTPITELLSFPASSQDLNSYADARRELGGMQVPVLIKANDAHERMFVAVFDGTGNDMRQDGAEHHTGVARIYQQIRHAEKQGRHLAAGYVEGPGTQENLLARVHDSATGSTVAGRAERMYEQYIVQSSKWLTQDPESQFRVAAIGFSRGAEEVALFTRMVHERGVQNPDGAVYTRDSNGNITHVFYTRPALISAGQTAQAVVLLDPVATGHARELDRRLPPSVISGFQISAEDEKRDQFQVTDHLDPGFSEDRRFLHVTVGGAHSDIGDWYARNGLGIRSTNLVVDYLNALSDRPFLAKRAEPEDASLNVVHRSDQSWIPYTKFHMLDGERNHRQDVAAPALCQVGAVRDCWNKEPMDRALDRQFEHRAVPIAPPPPWQASPMQSGPFREAQPQRNALDLLFEGLGRAAFARDAAAMRSIGRDYLASPGGQDWLLQGHERNQQAREPVPTRQDRSEPVLEAPSPRIRALQH